jgi:UDP-glucose 4-epimerase
MRVLVIGGNGFIGSRLVAHLREEGVAVRVLDPGLPRAGMAGAGVEFVRGSLVDVGLLPTVLAGVDVVYHLASTTVPATSNLDPQADVRDNLVATLGLLQAMRVARVRRIVYFSSGGTVYGNTDAIAVAESQPLHPVSSYGVVKVAVEHYLRMYRELGDIEPTVLRPSNPYGPGQSTSGVQGAVGTFLARASRGERITIWGDGEVVRDYLFIDDLVALAARAGQAPTGGTYNVGSGVGHSLRQVCDIVSQVTNRHLDIEYLPGRPFDVKRIVLDIGAAEAAFAWKPQVALAEGIARTWRSFQ